MDAPNPQANPLIRKLETVTTLPDEARQAILRLPITVRDLKADADIARDHSPSQCCLVLTGFLCRYKILDNGRRQIFSFHIPGDIPDNSHGPQLGHARPKQGGLHPAPDRS